jgi:hypothetical protein
VHWIIHRIHNSVRICDIEPGQPHRLRTFKRSRDPSFPAKLADIVGLYVDPPAHAAVLSLDEKSQIQALDRTNRDCRSGIRNSACRSWRR